MEACGWRMGETGWRRYSKKETAERAYKIEKEGLPVQIKYGKRNDLHCLSVKPCAGFQYLCHPGDAVNALASGKVYHMTICFESELPWSGDSKARRYLAKIQNHFKHPKKTRRKIWWADHTRCVLRVSNSDPSTSPLLRELLLLRQNFCEHDCDDLTISA